MKQMLSTNELIQHMKSKGIRFNIVSDNEASAFLTYNNYYFKLASYRTLYPKCPEGSKRSGQYQNLEFAYLKELSTIDMHLRYIIVEMCLDIEHAIKVKLINAAANNPNEDGYQIVKDFFSAEDPDGKILQSIRRHKSGEYCKDLIAKYDPSYPIWVLAELISFGDLMHICMFYEKKYKCKILPKNKLMNIVRDLRNASAHSNCMLNKMTAKMEISKQPDYTIIAFVRSIAGISKASCANNLKKTFVYNMVALLYVYNQLMPYSSKRKRYTELAAFMNGRVNEHADYFKTNPQIISVYVFLKKIIDSLSQQE